MDFPFHILATIASTAGLTALIVGWFSFKQGYDEGLRDGRMESASVTAGLAEAHAMQTRKLVSTEIRADDEQTRRWLCGKCESERLRGFDDGQIPEHHRTCPKRSSPFPINL